MKKHLLTLFLRFFQISQSRLQQQHDDDDYADVADAGAGGSSFNTPLGHSPRKAVVGGGGGANRNGQFRTTVSLNGRAGGGGGDDADDGYGRRPPPQTRRTQPSPRAQRRPMGGGGRQNPQASPRLDRKSLQAAANAGRTKVRTSPDLSMHGMPAFSAERGYFLPLFGRIEPSFRMHLAPYIVHTTYYVHRVLRTPICNFSANMRSVASRMHS